jgi:hypothetical protein
MAPKKKTDADEIDKMMKVKPPPIVTPEPTDHLATATTSKPGRGSVSVSNKFAMWTGCQECQSRLSYVPAFGAHGMTRKAGPLTVDTERALDKIAQNEQKD